MPDIQPLDLARQLRQDGYYDAAECLERLYQLVIDVCVDNLQLRGRELVEPTEYLQ